MLSFSILQLLVSRAPLKQLNNNNLMSFFQLYLSKITKLSEGKLIMIDIIITAEAYDLTFENLFTFS